MNIKGCHLDPMRSPGSATKRFLVFAVFMATLGLISQDAVLLQTPESTDVRLFSQDAVLLRIPESTDNRNASSVGNASSVSKPPAPPPRCMDLLVVSDRGSRVTMPFQGLVHSILAYTSMPVRLNVVSSSSLAWLNEIANQTKHFSVFYHDPKPLFEQAENLIKNTGYNSTHYSSGHAAIKLFLPNLAFPPGTQKVLFMDDDSVFYDDLTPLYDDIQANVNRLSLYCPMDPKRVQHYFTKNNRSSIGHPERYCVPALMGIPVGPNSTYTSDMSKAVAEIMQIHPDFVGRVAADQDGINRLYATSHQKIDVIPCDWHCDLLSCTRSEWHTEGPRCTNCPIAQTKGRCRGAHFIKKLFRDNNLDLGRPEWNWRFYNDMNATELVDKVYDPRVEHRTVDPYPSVPVTQSRLKRFFWW
jgi:hypothetical protein